MESQKPTCALGPMAKTEAKHGPTHAVLKIIFSDGCIHRIRVSRPLTHHKVWEALQDLHLATVSLRFEAANGCMQDLTRDSDSTSSFLAIHSEATAPIRIRAVRQLIKDVAPPSGQENTCKSAVAEKEPGSEDGNSKYQDAVAKSTTDILVTPRSDTTLKIFMDTGMIQRMTVSGPLTFETIIKSLQSIMPAQYSVSFESPNGCLQALTPDTTSSLLHLHGEASVPIRLHAKRMPLQAQTDVHVQPSEVAAGPVNIAIAGNDSKSSADIEKNNEISAGDRHSHLPNLGGISPAHAWEFLNADDRELQQALAESMKEAELQEALAESIKEAELQATKAESSAAARQRLAKVLEIWGAFHRPVRGDGNCQFRALAQQLHGDEDRHSEIRAAAVKEMREYPELYADYVGGNFNDYLGKMSCDGEWGDHVTLQAVCNALQVWVNIFTDVEDAPHIVLRPKGGGTAAGGRSLFLSFLTEVHYDSVDLPSEDESWVVVDQPPITEP